MIQVRALSECHACTPRGGGACQKTSTYISYGGTVVYSSRGVYLGRTDVLTLLSRELDHPGNCLFKSVGAAVMPHLESSKEACLRQKNCLHTTAVHFCSFVWSGACPTFHEVREPKLSPLGRCNKFFRIIHIHPSLDVKIAVLYLFVCTFLPQHVHRVHIWVAFCLFTFIVATNNNTTSVTTHDKKCWPAPPSLVQEGLPPYTQHCRVANNYPSILNK